MSIIAFPDTETAHAQIYRLVNFGAHRWIPSADRCGYWGTKIPVCRPASERKAGLQVRHAVPALGEQEALAPPPAVFLRRATCLAHALRHHVRPLAFHRARTAAERDRAALELVGMQLLKPVARPDVPQAPVCGPRWATIRPSPMRRCTRARGNGHVGEI